jgi:hypothetical protein
MRRCLRRNGRNSWLCGRRRNRWGTGIGPSQRRRGRHVRGRLGQWLGFRRTLGNTFRGGSHSIFGVCHRDGSIVWRAPDFVSLTRFWIDDSHTIIQQLDGKISQRIVLPAGTANLLICHGPLGSFQAGTDRFLLWLSQGIDLDEPTHGASTTKGATRRAEWCTECFRKGQRCSRSHDDKMSPTRAIYVQCGSLCL